VAFSYNYILTNNLANWTVYLTGIKRVEAVDTYTVKSFCTAPKADVLTDRHLHRAGTHLVQGARQGCRFHRTKVKLPSWAQGRIKRSAISRTAM